MLNPIQSKMLPNQYILKKYNDDEYRLIIFKNSILNAGYEEEHLSNVPELEPEEYQKHECNISRTRAKIYEYAACNEFEYFVTFTLNKKNLDRYDLDLFITKFGQFIRNYRRIKGLNIQYILIPEQHKDGAWHMHGLINGIDQEELKPFTVYDKIPLRIKNLVRAGRVICNWERYEKKFGWVTLEKIRNKKAVSKYITKYVKKDIGVSVIEKNKKSYYVTRGLKLSTVEKKGTFPTLLRNALVPDFENEFVSLFDLNKSEYEFLLSQL